jgi:hypothetical protein
MIAAACIATGLAPEAFGVPSSPALGAVMLDVLREQAREQKRESMMADLRARGG